MILVIVLASVHTCSSRLASLTMLTALGRLELTDPGPQPSSAGM